MYLVKGRHSKAESDKDSSNDQITTYLQSNGQFFILQLDSFYGFSSLFNRLHRKGILENVNTL